MKTIFHIWKPVFICAVVIFFCSSIGGSQVGESGTTFRLRLQTPHPLQGPSVDGKPIWEDVLHHEGATWLWINFSKFELNEGAEMIISSPNGQQSETYTGKGVREKRGNFWSTRIYGDTASIKVFSEVADVGFGYITNKYIATIPGDTGTVVDPEPDPYVRQLKTDYKQAGWVFSGTYVRKEKVENEERPYTNYTFENREHFKKTSYYGDGKPDDITTTADYHRKSSLDTAKRGERHIVFLRASDGSISESLPETAERIKRIRGWVEYGVHTNAELKDLNSYADWIVVVKTPVETCSKSSPCQHRWRFPVVMILKGEDVPSEIDIRGEYMLHDFMSHSFTRQS